MNDFVDALVSDGLSPELPEEHDWFGRLIDSWKLDYFDRKLASSAKGEWIFERVLGPFVLAVRLAVEGVFGWSATKCVLLCEDSANEQGRIFARRVTLK